ncbi:AbrB/MazE/SpoVT family DNA-binding domain-containing protein [Nitrosopumilus sp.]|uniref:AbrB/MazE/SpoVT family DNA-binding domain-containing protein n=1 Tax=Nitrosopumilus sp. TaxID=2024843 RepID=UPI0029316319|nr:AbrB/MazE/SpoVT family DNA-binding domain-containing protein [Nitrosopumilus sp.]
MDKTTLKTINVSDKGQITIPREIQTMLGIKKGDRLILAAKDKRLLIQKASSLERQIEDDFKDLLKLSEKTTAKSLWDNKEDEIWNKA